jgi:hypothetical protein
MKVKAILAGSVLLMGCAETAVVGPGGEGPATVAEVVCEADGSTTILTPRVLAQPDGVHVHAVSHLDEWASLNGFGFDIENGETDFVVDIPPGVINEACWPYSLHETLEEPATQPIHVLDPEGSYVDDDVQCSGSIGSYTADFAEAPLDQGPVPLDEARARLEGLQEGDEVRHAGYPGQTDRSVIVIRDEEVVASFSFVTFGGGGWAIAGATICESSGISQGY